jgi:hypothetical protein
MIRTGDSTMKRIYLLIFLLLSLPLKTPAAAAENISVEVEDLSCKDGHFFLKGSVENRYTYDRHLLIAYKISKGNKTVGCETTDLTIHADSRTNQEISFGQSCEEEEAFALQYMIYDRRDRGRAAAWLADCPD